MTSSDPLATLATPYGSLAGRTAHGVRRFLGIPYAQPPVGALRLGSPRKPSPWRDVRPADIAGAAHLQHIGGSQRWLYETPARQSEDCLTLNVWTPEHADKAPVLVWFHGGATRHGFAGAAAFDGTALAAREGLVVVTVNYRIGALGGLAHPDLADAETGLCANWGLQDKVAALEWVAECIGAFGGDPARVTVAGQSSGAAQIALMMQNRIGQGLFARAILHSPPLFRQPMFAELDEAARYTEQLAAELGCEDVRALRRLDGATLQRVEREWASQPSRMTGRGRPRTAPVRDGRWIRQWSFDAPAGMVPALIGWTRHEADFWFDLYDEQGAELSAQRPPASDAELRARVETLIGQHYAFEPLDARDAIARYAAHGSPAAIWRALYTDLVFRAPILQWAGRQATAGQPVYAYEFAHPLPTGDGSAPHAVDVPFLFGTVRHPRFVSKWRDADAADAVSRALQARWAAFARDGEPGHGWPAFDPMVPRLLVVDSGAPAIATLDRRDELDTWPAYRRLAPPPASAASRHAELRSAASEACALLKVLANEDRLLLLCELFNGECNVGELEQRTGIRQPTLSQQLGALRAEQVVGVRKEGRYVYYRLVCPNTLSLMHSLSSLYCGRVGRQ